MAFNYTDTSFTTPLLRAIEKNEPEKVREALGRGFNANLPDNRGWTPLHVAAVSDVKINCLKEMLSHSSASINNQNFLGSTPLFLACENNSVKTVNVLLKQPKCDVNLANNEGVSPLHIACSQGNIKAVKSLVEFGAKVNAHDFNGYTPLHDVASGIGVQNRDEVAFEICHYLLKHEANPDIVEYEGNNPFHFACQNGLLKCSDLLYKACKQRDAINFRNSDGRSPLMLAVPSKNQALVEALLSLGANPNIADHYNITALHLAAHSANFNIFNLILETTSKECVLKYCTFDEENDYESVLSSKRLNSLICLAIDTEDLPFLVKILECNLDKAVLQCPVIHTENVVKRTFTLHTPVSFLLESKMYDLGEKTLDYLLALIDHGSPLKLTSKRTSITFVNPVCAALVALNDCPLQLVMKCLRVLLLHGADPDERHGRMPFAMEQACMRGCSEAVLLLLQHSNVLEPEDVLTWVEEETSFGQEKILEMLLPLAPYYAPSDNLLPDLIDSPTRKYLLAPKVYSLANYCRTVVRNQLHKETKSSPELFRHTLSTLCIPKNLYHFLNYK